jgi:hypothetical protein
MFFYVHNGICGSQSSVDEAVGLLGNDADVIKFRWASYSIFRIWAVQEEWLLRPREGMQRGPPKRLYLPIDTVSYSNILNRLEIFAFVLSCDSLQFLLHSSWVKQRPQQLHQQQQQQ